VIGDRLPVASPARSRTYLRKLLAGHKLRLSAAAALSFAAALSSMAAPYFVGRLTAEFAAGNLRPGPVPSAEPAVQMLWILAGILGHAGFTWAAYRNLTTLSENLAAEIREDFLEHTLRQPPGRVEGAGTGELLSRTTLDVNQVQQAIVHAGPSFFAGGLTAAVYLVGAFAVAPALGATALIAIPSMALVLRWYFRHAASAFHAVQNARSDLTVVVAETIDGIRTVEAFSWQDRRLALTDKAIGELRSAQRKVIGIRRVLMPVLDFSAFLPVFAVLAVGGTLTATGNLPLAATVTVALLMYQTVSPVVEMILSLEWIQLGGVSLTRLVGVRMPPSQRSGGHIASARDDIVQVDGVDFGYTDDRLVLRGIELTLRRGERVALVGPTGAGKSTLAKLITGFHRPTRGTVYIRGVDAADLDEAALRRTVVMASQEYHLFNDTLAANLRLGAPNATERELAEAMRAVGAGDLLKSLPEGVRTRVGGRDHTLTPAEIQQIAVARVALAAPEVIVLDEATSMMSPGAASMVETGFDRLLAGRTVVTIAHRLNSAHAADRVVVVAQGRIAEAGTHDELVVRDGVYAALWKRWRE
jgi:ABC-type multidrug transport system fused ATPase/permease subunit